MAILYHQVVHILAMQGGFIIKKNQCNSLFSDSKGKRKIFNKIHYPFLKNFQ